MAFTFETATTARLDDVVAAVASWQHDGGSVQVHPGDLGWNWSNGAEKLAAEVRVWRRDGEAVAVGLVDEDSGLVRMALAKTADHDEEIADRLLADLSSGFRLVEARFGTALRHGLARDGWQADEAWAPLVRDLAGPVPEHGLRIEVVGPETAGAWVAVHRAAFATSTFSLQRWQRMAASSAFRGARCLLGFDDQDVPVAATTVWSAGPGRPGLIEPLGVHRDHRGNGHGVAITRAAASALQELGSSSARVCTPSANTGGVAAYGAAGFDRLPDVTDFRRPD
ncbi:MAG: GNAT family N-acetyltransferase [Marmoricola sp.]